MSKLIKQVLGAVLVSAFAAESPVMAADVGDVMEGVTFKVTRVGSSDDGGHFFIFTDPINPTRCTWPGGWRNALIVPRSIPNFNDVVSLATAAMLSGKQIAVSTGKAFKTNPCDDGTGNASGSTYGIARISRLDVIN